MTKITGDMVDSGDENLWSAGGVYVVNEEQTEIAGKITLDNTAEYGTAVVVDEDGVESTTCSELFSGSPATQDTGTNEVQTTAAGTDEMYANYVDITTPLQEVFACKDVSFKMAAAEFTEPVQGQILEVQKTGTIKWDMSVSMMYVNPNFKALVFGSKITDSPITGWVKHHTATKGINKIGILVGSRYVSGVLKAKYICLGCSVKSLTDDLPASGFAAESFDFLVDAKMEIAKV